MKLFHDCVRDVMLYLEDNLEDTYFINSESITLKKYSSKDITYTLKKLAEAGFIEIDKVTYENNFNIKWMTYYGHQFLDNIRDNKVWSETKSILSKFSSVSLNMVQNIASQVISNLIIASLNK
nr:MAG TPA: YjcQ protein [Caudoviricetes sp.]